MQFRDEYIRDSELVGKAVADSILMRQSAAYSPVYGHGDGTIDSGRPVCNTAFFNRKFIVLDRVASGCGQLRFFLALLKQQYQHQSKR